MNAWLYSGPEGLRALTSDEDGACLPVDLGPWRLVRSVELGGGSADEQEAIALIAEHEFCCFEEEQGESAPL